jgi:hypothetical protein
MFVSLVEVLVKDDDSLEVDPRVDVPVAVVPHLIQRKSYLIAINIVISRSQGLLRSTAIRRGTF